MSSPFTLDSTVHPDHFRGRAGVLKIICERLEHSQRLSTCVAGGPKTGKSSLLRYLESDRAGQQHPVLQNYIRVFFQGETIGSAMTPPQFWFGIFRELGRHVDAGPAKDLLAGALNRARQNQLEIYDLEDVFDALAREGTPVVLLIDAAVNLLTNQHFWPPNDFFHQVRALGQRVPRGLSFVFATPRALLELWDSNRGASPFYNIFVTQSLGQLDENEIRDLVRRGFAELGLASTEAIEQLVITASEGHPYLVNYVASHCAEMLQQAGMIDGAELGRALSSESVVILIRQIRAQLSAYERDWIDQAQANPGQLTATKRDHLSKLRKYGLLPPGLKIP